MEQYETVPKTQIVKDRDIQFQALEKSRLGDLPYQESQEELEALFSKNQLYKRLTAEFECPEIEELYRNSGIAELGSYGALVSMLVFMAIAKRADPSTLIGVVFPHFENGDSRIMVLQRTANFLERAAETDFVNYDMELKKFIIEFDVSPDVQQEIDRYQYPLPLVVAPRNLRNNNTSGYHGELCKGGGAVLNGNRAGDFYRENDVCLDHINRMNAIPLALNLNVANHIENSWSDIDKRRIGESQEDFEKRQKAFNRYTEASRDVIHGIAGIRDRMWLTHKYDRRGRVYCQGYHVTYQGNSWNKAIVELAEKETVNV